MISLVGLVMGTIKSFDSYFTWPAIVRALCRLRITKARKRHDEQFLYNISTNAKPRTSHDELYDYFPPRRQWIRLREQERRGRGSIDIYQQSLERTVFAFAARRENSILPWLARLNHLVASLRYEALMNPMYRMEQPRITFVEKSKQGKEYRSIASYGLRDQIVGGQCAKYLRAIFDEDFVDSSFAFRVARKSSPSSSRGGKTPEHHDAVEKLLDFRQKFSNQPLWVAECDIRGFYDSVHHEKARIGFMLACDRARHRNIEVDPRAVKIFEAYLRSYSFTAVARHSFNEAQAHGKFPEGILKWPATALAKFWGKPENQPIGVPQGGAISCVIANLVLDSADRAVLGDGRQNLFYARYCDDMIIASPDRNLCQDAFNRYVAVLESMALPHHEVKPINSYGKHVWDSKSKGPYRWANRNCESDVPWVAFVGYQIRHDGLIRIRPASLRKELEKQVQVAQKLLNSLFRSKGETGKLNMQGIRRTKRQIIFRLRQRLISMSVGRRFLNSVTGKLSAQCWAVGFKLLNERNFIFAQLRKLDHGREKQIRRVKKAIKTLSVRREGREIDNQPKHWGRPFSYAGQFKRIVAARSAQANDAPPTIATLPVVKTDVQAPRPTANVPESESGKTDANVADAMELQVVHGDSSE